MSFVYELIVVVHLLGMGAMVGAFVVVLRAPRYVPAFLYGAVTQLVSGIVLVGVRESGVLTGEDPINHVKITVKLLLSLAAVVLAWSQRKNTESAPHAMIHSIGAIAVVEVAVAALWS